MTEHLSILYTLCRETSSLGATRRKHRQVAAFELASKVATKTDPE